MQRKHRNASVAAALVIGAGAALALNSASIALWLGAGAAVGVVLAAVLSNLVSETETGDRARS
jgi:uncharacterized membrane protein